MVLYFLGNVEVSNLPGDTTVLYMMLWHAEASTIGKYNIFWKGTGRYHSGDIMASDRCERSFTVLYLSENIEVSNLPGDITGLYLSEHDDASV